MSSFAGKAFGKVSEFLGDVPTDPDNVTRPEEFYDTFVAKRARIAIMSRSDAASFIEFDAEMDTNFESKSVPTVHPVEGTNVSDHILLPPEECSMRVVVSNFPLAARDNGGGNISDGFGYDASLDERDPIVAGGDPRARAEDALKWLRDVRNKRYVVDVFTSLQDYTNMVLTRISVSRDKNTFHIVDIRLSFQEFLVATTEKIDAPKPLKPARKAATNKGKQTKTPADTKTNESALHRLLSTD